MHQRLRGAKRRRALHRKRRRMYLLVQQMNQNLRVLQMLLTRTTLLLLAMVRLVNPRLWIVSLKNSALTSNICVFQK